MRIPFSCSMSNHEKIHSLIATFFQNFIRTD